ncbi:MAG: ATP-binding cassette domain-containing protein [Sphaerochaetaceae bacterium]|nr:ATP-binding cassette domain-containing protein [Sphaerochaetaceae bacterium]
MIEKKESKIKDIIIDGISKSFQDKKVFSNFSGKIVSGITNCFFGPSGSGKTTLIRILLNLDTVDDGKILNIDQLKKSVVFQEDRLCENLSSLINVKMVMDSNVDNFLATQLLIELGLEENINQKVAELSGGMKRRVAIARALASEYDLLILDEPFKGLDNKTREETIKIVKRQSLGKTVVLVTHDLKEAELLDTKNYIYF